MANYRTELRIPVERNNKSIADDDYFKFDDPSMVTLNDNWKYNSNNTNNWDSRSRHTSNSEQISHDIPWYKRLRTTSADPMRYTDTDYLYDDMKRRMEERRRRWNEEFKLLHNDILLPSRLKSSNDLFNSRETINSPTSHDIISKNSSSNSGYEQFPDGSVHFVSNFNLSGYDPELLKVFVRDGKLMVVAKTEHNHSTNSINTTMNTNNSNNNSISSFREYTHSINLPPGVDDEKLSAVLSLNGILTVSCPMKPPSFTSSTNLQSPYSDHLSNSLWNNHHQHYRHHYQSPSIKSQQQQQQYSRKFDLKSPKFNHSARSSHSDYDIISHDQQDYHSRHPSSLIQQLQQQPRKHRFRLELPIDSEYSPGEIQIKTLNHRIYIKARHEERAPNRTSVREFSKEYDIPDNIDPESLTAKFSNGILYIEEPIV